MLAGKFLSCGGLFGSIMAGSGEEERLPRTRHYISTNISILVAFLSNWEAKDNSRCNTC